MNLQDKPDNAKTIDPQTRKLLDLAIEAVDELKGESVQVLDVADLTTIADHMVICSGRSARHVKRLGETVIAHAKDAGIQPRVEGLNQAEWVLIDLNGVVVHIMQPVTRAYYQLEKLWDMDAATGETPTAH
ncbi:ribosome silencing factor [Endozoicomonas sp. G2_2]|uniref:ribosome silencing factor n=1 Tax=Gammaproteobacteria TaxID=1236 RepID=UPI000C438B9E|nr:MULTISPECIES: ribosome silencing factor [Gammaproteobacteria]MAS10565.1 ribosome silencing factor [Salinisphaera sp.]MBO9468633.1 ribosome silencing factor [Endozoicomonas sp. G2_2]|tara:strand:+ start:2169 stop:2561 length:393 start_codon:yes stop_codon:yes gene_type:complete